MSSDRRAVIARSNSRAAQEDRERLQGQEGAKRCSKCEAWKPLGAFAPDRRTTSGRKSWCRVCCNRYTSEYQRSELGRATRRAYNERPEVKAMNARKRRRYEQTTKGKAARIRYRRTFRSRLLGQAVYARYWLRRVDGESSIDTHARALWRIGREVARIDRQRESA